MPKKKATTRQKVLHKTQKRKFKTTQHILHPKILGLSHVLLMGEHIVLHMLH